MGQINLNLVVLGRSGSCLVYVLDQLWTCLVVFRRNESFWLFFVALIAYDEFWLLIIFCLGFIELIFWNHFSQIWPFLVRFSCFVQFALNFFSRFGIMCGLGCFVQF